MLGNKVAKGAASLGAFQLFNRVLDLLSIVILARILVPADFGLVALATSVMMVAQTASDLPVIDALVQRSSIQPRDIDSAFTLNLLRGVFVTLAMVALSWPMALFYEDMRLISMITVLSLVPLCKSLESPALVHSLREVNYGPTSKALLVGKLVGTVLSVILAVLTHSFWALIIGLVANGLISCFWTYYQCPYRPRFRRQGMMELIDFAGWITLSKIIFSLNQQGDRFFVGYFIGKAPLGQYTMGSEIASLATYSLAGPVTRPIFAGMSRIQDDVARLHSAYIKSQQMIMLVVLPFGFGLAAVADGIVPLVLGSGWDQAVVAVWWIAPVVALQMLSVSVHALAMSQGATRMLVLREGFSLLLRLPATLVGAWLYGLLGALIARSITGVIIIVMNLFVARKLIGVGVMAQLLNGWRSLFSVMIMTGIMVSLNLQIPVPGTFIIQSLRVTLILAAGFAVYGAVGIVLWRASGCPESAEIYIIELLARTLRRVVRSKRD